MNRQKKAILCKLNDCKGDITKQWFIYFSFLNPVSKKLERFRIYEGFTNYSSKKDKQAHANRLIKKYNRKLKADWNPFENNEVLYTEATAYVKDGKLESKADFSIKHYLNNILNNKKGGIRKKSNQSYTTQIRVFLEWLIRERIDHLDISEFDLKRAERFMLYLEDERRLKGGTWNGYLRILKSFFKELQEKEVIQKNPFDKLKKVKAVREGKLPFKDHQIKLLKDYFTANQPQLWLFCQFQFYCFVRPGELRMLKVSDINFETNQIQVRGDISKNNKTQFVSIPLPFLKVLVKEKLFQVNEDYYIFGRDGKPGPKMVGTNYFSDLHRTILKDQGISDKYSLYSWKHTGAVKAARTPGISLKDLQLQIRHHDLNTLDIYLKSMGVNESQALHHNFPEV